MNILLISSIYPEPASYGITPDTKAIHYFAKSWILAGHNVVVIHPYWNAVSKISRAFKYDTHKIKIYEFEGVNVIFGECQVLVPHKNSAFSVQQVHLARRMKKIYKSTFPNFKADKVVIHFPSLAPHFNQLFLIKGISYCTLHGVDLRTLANNSYKTKIELINYLNSSYNAILYRSEVLSIQGAKIGLKQRPENLVLSGIDKSLISPQNVIEEKLNIKKSTIRFIYAGKLNRQKRIDVIINALSKVKGDFKFVFTVIGDGPELGSLQRLTSSLGMSSLVEFVGRKTRNEVSDYMGNADVFVMLSKGETLGLVYLEAMAKGCLCIGSKGEGIDGIILNGKNGFLCTPDNLDNAIETIKIVGKLSASEFKTIAQCGYDTVVKLTSEKMAENYLKLLQ